MGRNNNINWNDKPYQWPAEFCLPYQTGFDPVTYQKKIDAIAGKSRDRSILRLVWGAAPTTSILRYTEWDEFGRATMETREPKYKIHRMSKFSSNIMLHVPVRRWIIEQLQEPEQYRIDDDSDTKFENEYGVVCKAADKPIDFYTPLIYVGNHDKCAKDCCAKVLCLGDYKDPGQPELDWIAECTADLAVTFNKENAYRPFTEWDVKLASIDHANRQPKKESIDDKIEQIIESIQ